MEPKDMSKSILFVKLLDAYFDAFDYANADSPVHPFTVKEKIMPEIEAFLGLPVREINE